MRTRYATQCRDYLKRGAQKVVSEEYECAVAVVAEMLTLVGVDQAAVQAKVAELHAADAADAAGAAGARV